MHQVPGHERGVAVGEVVLRAAAARVEVRRPRPGLADPAGVGLRRDRVADVLQRVEDVLRAVLDAVLVAGDQRAGRPGRRKRTGPSSLVRCDERVEPLDDLLGDAGVVAEPDRPGDHEDVGVHHLRVDVRPLVASPSRARSCRGRRRWRCRGRRRAAPRRDAVLAHDRRADVDQPLGVAQLRRALERAVDEHRLEAAEVVVHASHCSPATAAAPWSEVTVP